MGRTPEPQNGTSMWRLPSSHQKPQFLPWSPWQRGACDLERPGASGKSSEQQKWGHPLQQVCTPSLAVTVTPTAVPSGDDCGQPYPPSIIYVPQNPVRVPGAQAHTRGLSEGMHICSPSPAPLPDSQAGRAQTEAAISRDIGGACTRSRAHGRAHTHTRLFNI